MGLQSSEGGYSTAATDQHRARSRRAFCPCLGAAGDARHDHEAAADAAKRGHVSRDDDRQHVDNNFHTVRRKSGLSFSRRLSRRLLGAKKMDLRVLRLLGSCRVSRLLSGSFDAHMTRLEVTHVLIVVWGARGGVWCVCLVCCVPGASGTSLVDLS